MVFLRKTMFLSSGDHDLLSGDNYCAKHNHGSILWIQQLYPFGISWFSFGKQCFFLREIMISLREIIIVRSTIMVRSFGSNNYLPSGDHGSILWIQQLSPFGRSWSDNQLLLFFPFSCYNKKYKQKSFVSIFVSKMYFLKRYKLYRIITKSTNKIL